MKLALSLAAALALPVSADVRIEATRPGVTDLTLPELMEFCAAKRPISHRWQGGA